MSSEYYDDSDSQIYSFSDNVVECNCDSCNNDINLNENFTQCNRCNIIICEDIACWFETNTCWWYENNGDLKYCGECIMNEKIEMHYRIKDLEKQNILLNIENTLLKKTNLPIVLIDLIKSFI